MHVDEDFGEGEFADALDGVVAFEHEADFWVGLKLGLSLRAPIVLKCSWQAKQAQSVILEVLSVNSSLFSIG